MMSGTQPRRGCPPEADRLAKLSQGTRRGPRPGDETPPAGCALEKTLTKPEGAAGRPYCYSNSVAVF